MHDRICYLIQLQVKTKNKGGTASFIKYMYIHILPKIIYFLVSYAIVSITEKKC